METGLGLMMSLVKRLNAMCADLCLKIGFKERYTDTVLTAERGWEARKMRLIDADETIREIVWNSLSESGEAIEATAKAIRCIENMPSIDTVKHGRWIRTTKADYVWECSVCGYGLCDNRTTYCYDCGARMDGEDNG